MTTIDIPGYSIIRTLGQGGMATVFLARQQSLQREVALKVMSEALNADASFSERFMREARVHAKLDHPNIVRVYDVGVYKHRHYLSMEYLRGTRLKDLGLALPVADALRIIGDIAAALDFAGRKGFVHRDVKPDNIIVREADGRAVLMDFGIAMPTGATSQLTQVGTAIGTPHYMSPEQARGETADSRSDIYSLGIVLFWALTGKLPFDADSAVAVGIKHVTDDVPRLPGELAWCQAIMDRVLAKDPEQRYQTGAELLEDLAAAAPPADTVPLGSTPSGGAEFSARVFPRPGLALWQLPAAGLSWLAGKLGGAAASERPAPTPPPEPASAPPASLNSPAGPVLTGAVGDSGTVVLPATFWQTGPQAPTPGQSPGQSPDATMIYSAPASRKRGETSVPAALIVLSAPDPGMAGKRVNCDHFPFVVGRDPGAGLCIERDASVSRSHLRIESGPGGYCVSDTSTNGLSVGGRLLQKGTSELPFDIDLKLSEKTTLRFVADIPSLPDLLDSVVGSRFVLERILHAGTKATTYVASDRNSPGRQLAIKIFSPQLLNLPLYEEGFRRQTELMARLQHPHICRVLDFGYTSVDVEGQAQELPFLCMDWMRGGSLGDLLKEETLEMNTILDWVGKLALALDYTHSEQIAHGDIKPGSIVFDGQGNPYLTDFAMALARESALQADESDAAVIGSPAFLAPEQWQGQGPSSAADQYSLAAVTYLMITGSRPHEGQEDAEVRRRNFQRGVLPAHLEAQARARADVPVNVTQVLNRALQEDPLARYPSTGDFSAALVEAVQAPRRPAEVKPRVFISYQRSASAGWATLFARELEDRYSYSVFVDTRARDRALLISQRVHDAISDCDIFVCLLSPSTLSSDWVVEEIRLAQEHGKPMVPVFQQGFREAPKGEELSSHVRHLLEHDGVHLMDRDNIHVDHTISDIAERVRRTTRTES